jgi:hypothetical protein
MKTKTTSVNFDSSHRKWTKEEINDDQLAAAIVRDAIACIEEREVMLRRCADQFRMYQASHMKKVTDLDEASRKWPLEHDELARREDAHAKAEANRLFADEIEKLLSESAQ